MKLYMHPVSTTSRPLMLLIAEHQLDIQQQGVDLFSGEHTAEAYAAINPNKMVPMLEEGDFRLTESASILRYLAEKFALPEYPQDLQQRARVNECLDWFNTQLYREFGYGLHYPQLFPQHKYDNDIVQQATIERGKKQSENWLSVLDRHIIGDEQSYLCGNEISIADYFGISLITLGEITRCDFSAYPNVVRWIDNMKQLPSWNECNAAFYGLAEQLKEQSFEAIGA